MNREVISPHRVPCPFAGHAVGECAQIRGAVAAHRRRAVVRNDSDDQHQLDGHQLHDNVAAPRGVQKERQPRDVRIANAVGIDAGRFVDGASASSPSAAAAFDSFAQRHGHRSANIVKVAAGCTSSSSPVNRRDTIVRSTSPNDIGRRQHSRFRCAGEKRNVLRSEYAAAHAVDGFQRHVVNGRQFDGRHDEEQKCRQLAGGLGCKSGSAFAQPEIVGSRRRNGSAATTEAANRDGFFGAVQHHQQLLFRWSGEFCGQSATYEKEPQILLRT